LLAAGAVFAVVDAFFDSQPSLFAGSRTWFTDAVVVGGRTEDEIKPVSPIRPPRPRSTPRSRAPRRRGSTARQLSSSTVTRWPIRRSPASAPRSTPPSDPEPDPMQALRRLVLSLMLAAPLLAGLALRRTPETFRASGRRTAASAAPTPP
jgi:hypothetical protein